MTSATKYPNNVAPPAPTGVYTGEPVAPPPPSSPADVPFVPVGGSGGGIGSIVIPLLGGNVSNLIVPPGGFAGFAQQTQATQALFQRAGRLGGVRSARRRKRRTAKKKAAAAPRRRRRTRSSPKRLVKGSAAAKRYMARIRKMRRR